MCGRVKISGLTTEPGQNAVIKTSKGYEIKTWRLEGMYNARSENLKSTWKEYERSSLAVDGFYEHTALIKRKDNKQLYLACINSNLGFMVVTRNAVGNIKKVHHRMAVAVEDPDLWIHTGMIIEIDYKKLIMTA